MLIEIDVAECLRRGISPTQYCYLKMLWDRNNTMAKQLYDIDSTSKDAIKNLVLSGYLLEVENSGVLLDRKKCEPLFKYTESSFWELFNTFPIKVPNDGGGSRVLRASDPKSVDAQTAKKKYESVVKSRAVHEHVMRCLNIELEERKKANNLTYMNGLVVWINNCAWQKYESFLKDEKPKIEESYGQNLV